MKEFIEKLIERLEELRDRYQDKYGFCSDSVDYGKTIGLNDAISIVNQLAVEYKNTDIITDFLQYARDNADNYDTNEGWSLSDLIDLSIKYSEKYINTSTDTSTNKSSGWIACSERLPSKEEFLKDDGRFIVTDGNRRYESCYDIYTKCFKTLKLFEFNSDGRNSRFVYDRLVIAWQSLPAPYKEGE